MCLHFTLDEPVWALITDCLSTTWCLLKEAWLFLDCRSMSPFLCRWHHHFDVGWRHQTGTLCLGTEPHHLGIQPWLGIHSKWSAWCRISLSANSALTRDSTQVVSLVQNLIIWKFNPDWKFNTSGQLDTKPHHLQVHPWLGIQSKWSDWCRIWLPGNLTLTGNLK